MKVAVKVRLKSSILDPQGKTVNNALHQLGYDSINSVRIGRLIELDVDSDDKSEVERIVREASEKLLANTVMEDYEIIYGGDSK